MGLVEISRDWLILKDSRSVALIWNYEMGNDKFAQATVLYLLGGSRLAENE